MELSEKQKQIVELRDKNILVSAAAGSGKTRVLVERIMDRLRDENDPTDIDSFLVLTFTKAAAGEMRDRIARAIAKELKASPTPHMEKQATLIDNASITTIDSFCLGILQNNFTEIGLEPGFKTASEAELNFIKEEALDQTVEELLAGKDIEFLEDFLNRFESRDSVKKIKEAIDKVYK